MRLGRLSHSQRGGPGKENQDICQRIRFSRCLIHSAKTHTHPTTLPVPTVNAQRGKQQLYRKKQQSVGTTALTIWWPKASIHHWDSNESINPTACRLLRRGHFGAPQTQRDGILDKPEDPVTSQKKSSICTITASAYVPKMGSRWLCSISLVFTASREDRSDFFF